MFVTQSTCHTTVASNRSLGLSETLAREFPSSRDLAASVTGITQLANSPLLKGVITPNQISLTNIVTYLQNSYREREMFYLTTHSTHFIYGYMASDIWLRTILTVRKETRCRHIGYSYRLFSRVLLYAPSHRQDNTYQGLCYTSRGTVTEAVFQTIGPLYLHAVCYLPFTNSPRKHTVILATYRKFTVATVRFTQNVS